MTRHHKRFHDVIASPITRRAEGSQAWSSCRRTATTIKALWPVVLAAAAGTQMAFSNPPVLYSKEFRGPTCYVEELGLFI